MRQIVLDTETTGLEPKQGHRIIEVGCIELIDRRETNQNFHQYINPERDIEDGAFNIHGLSNEFLSNKPRFSDIAQEFIEFIRDSELIIHNAPFDVGFINSELKLLGKKWGRVEDYCTVFDTLILAREKHPGRKNNLDALCKRYEVDNSQRDLHGALLDAKILVDVYLKMTGGQTDLSFDSKEIENTEKNKSENYKNKRQEKLVVIEPTESESQHHHLLLKSIKEKNGGKCLWSESELD